MDKNKDKKQTYVLRVLMMISTVVLIILFFATMSMVGKIQGTARVVNYVERRSVSLKWKMQVRKKMR